MAREKQGASAQRMRIINVDDEVYDAIEAIARKRWITLGEAVGVAVGIRPRSESKRRQKRLKPHKRAK